MAKTPKQINIDSEAIAIPINPMSPDPSTIIYMEKYVEAATDEALMNISLIV